MNHQEPLQIDCLILGGGIAGLWTLDHLVERGHSCLLVEPFALGAGQSIWSQGIIHGGLKYTLSGLMNPSAQAVSEMPELWRACLRGDRTPDLSAAGLRSDHCHLWQTSSLMSRAGMIGARLGLRVAPVVLERSERPAMLRECPGVVARLDEPVIDVGRVLGVIAARHSGRILQVKGPGSIHLERSGSGGPGEVHLRSPGGRAVRLLPRRLILCAGAGNQGLREALGLAPGRTQLRPLHMVLVRGVDPAALPPLFGHCVDGAKTRLTITSATDSAGRTVWQLGGELAEAGVGLDQPALLRHARAEVLACLPGLNLGRTEWSAYRADRAEPAVAGGRRPEDAAILVEQGVISAWPTKLALAPRLATLIAAECPAPAGSPTPPPDGWPAPPVALPPWESEAAWIEDGALGAGV